MHLIKNEKVINIMESTLNHVDSRLIDHGKRVAYLMFKILESQHTYNDTQLRDICIMAMLHDIGAYKTEEIDKMVIFETINVWEHSIYGYLFLKHFSPLQELATAVLYHHAECSEITHLEPTQQFLAQLLSLCDRADISVLFKGGAATFSEHIQKYRDIRYRSDIVDLFLTSGINIDTVFKNLDSDPAYNRIFRNTPLTEDAVSGYIKMIIFSIDFRSSQTVIHTIATTCIAGLLAGFMGASEGDIQKIKTGAMLHDIGKMGIPLHILESTGRLSDSDMEIMRSHVVMSDKILYGNIDDDVRNIAVNHHEKLDGTGYPRQLQASEIALYDRMVAIADIFSALCGARSYKDAYPKEKIIGILNSMSGYIDPEIVSLAITHFDEIMEAIDRESMPVIQHYHIISEEYAKIREEIETILTARNK